MSELIRLDDPSLIISSNLAGQVEGLRPALPKRPGLTNIPIFQIHPSLRCNLQCPHCYSSSGPHNKTSLEVETVCKAISDAADLGYMVVSVSGGEPLLYEGLYEVLSYAKRLGLTTTVTTNGFFLNARSLDNLKGLLDLLAISLDGPEELHNQMRGSQRAFDHLERGLDYVRAADFTFGFLHTVTSQTWQFLPWLAEFALTQQAKLFQIHPLVNIGRARTNLGEVIPYDEILGRIYLLGFVLRYKYYNQMEVQLDLVHRDNLVQNPEVVYATELEGDFEACCPAELLSVIVLEADGTIVPVSYGLSHTYKICNVYQQGLRRAWPLYLRKDYPIFRNLCRDVFENINSWNKSLPLYNWQELVVLKSLAFGS